MSNNKKLKPTPGNWEAVPSELDPKKHSWAILSDNHKDLIADVYKKRHWDGVINTDAPEVSEANAKLLAAAPELLDALIECTKALKMVISGPTTKPYIQKALKAIAKATK